MYVRLVDLADAGLTSGQVIAAAALAVTELGTAHALVMIHGEWRGAARYFEAGGRVRFDAQGDPWVPVYPEPRRRGR
jgi:hypothetical protein